MYDNENSFIISDYNEFSNILQKSNLKKIDGSSIHKICSGQVIIDFESVIKELIENSIDANASSINIVLENGGFNTIKVTDNGNGITKADYHSIALKHFTSKIRNFEDLQKGINSLGFRGEALSSLCAISQKFKIYTKTKDDKSAVCLNYDRNGNLIDITPISHPIGTTVIVENIFKPTPVRLENYKKKYKREFNKIVNRVQEYSIAHNNVTFTISGESYNENILSQRTQKSRNILKTIGNGVLQDAIASIYGFKQINQIDEFSYNSENIKMNGFVSKLDTNCGRRVGDRQFIKLNGRPVDIPKINRIFNEIYRKSNPSRYPVLFLSIIIKQGTYDINISPNKRCVMLEDEKTILNEIREYIIEHHWSMQSAIFTQNIIINTQSSSLNHKENILIDSQQSKNNTKKSLSFSGRLHSIRNVKSPSPQSFKSILSKYSLITEDIEEFNEEFITKDKSKKIRKTNSSPSLNIPKSITNNNNINNVNNKKDNNININSWTPTPKKFQEQNENSKLLLSKIHREINGVDKLEEELQNLLKNNDNHIYITDDHELINKYKYDYSSVHDQIQDNPIDIKISLNDIKNKLKYKNNIKLKNNINNTIKKQKMFKSNLDTSEIESNEELQRIFDKNDFTKINICGQFNCGFIIGKLDKDLFIFDQHACDEKYTYEKLYKTLDIKVQPLLTPQKLQLSPSDEDIIISEREIFKQNGFQFKYLYNEEPGRRLCLITLPYSKNTNFSIEDVMEMIFILKNNPGNFCRPSKIDYMLASRACRSSVMIGQSLSSSHMRQITTNMQNLNNPWSCPHGRPTMRHLYSLK